MGNSEIQKNLIKFLNNSSSKDELDMLNEWIQNPLNEELFREHVKTHYEIILGMNNPDSNEIRENLLKEIRKEKKMVFKIKQTSFLKYAAVAVLLIGVMYVFKTRFFDPTPLELLTTAEEVITIDLGNGDVQIISPHGQKELVDSKGKVIGTQQGSQLVYAKDEKINELIYNTITIPYGKKFEISLSDKTVVYLNSGTSLKYPIQFIDGQPRKVFIKGEAYFKVSKNESDPFIVNAQELDVKVFGTEFNVVAYPEDQETDVILIEGSVGLSKKDKSLDAASTTLLQPGFKGSFDKEQKTIDTRKVNTLLYTSWMEGTIVFRNEPFKNILKKLERLYNIQIINNNESLSNETFNATIEINKETLEDVLHYFNKVHEIQYQIVNNKLVIN